MAGEPLLKVEGVETYYGNIRALAGVNIEVQKGEIACLIGANGAGKSTLSGGEQQMLSIGRALMARPKLLLLDEPSLGLAPLIVKQIFEAVKVLNKEQGLTVFLVEQNAFAALKLSDRAYVMVNGNVTMSGTGKELLANPEVRAAYLEGGGH